MFTAETLATFLHTAGIGTFTAATGEGNIFVALVPDRPDVAITVTDLGGEYDPAVKEAVTVFQIRARGPRGEQTAPRDLLNTAAKQITSAGYGPPTVWATGTPYAAKVIYAEAGIPGSIGWDDNGRPEASMRVSVRWAEPNL